MSETSAHHQADPIDRGTDPMAGDPRDPVDLESLDGGSGRQLASTDGGSDVAHDADLSAALQGLLQMAVGGQSLEDSLTWIATLAVLAIPGAQGAGITMLEDGRSQTVCTTHEFVRAVDDIQYGLGEGPCITAAHEARTVRSGTLGRDQSWPRFGPRVARLGVNSVVSLPMILPGGEVVGAMNVYSHRTDAFTAEAAEHGEQFAAPAAVAVANARQFMQSCRLTAQLQAALTNRAVIDQAIGILRSRQCVSSSDLAPLVVTDFGPGRGREPRLQAGLASTYRFSVGARMMG